MGKTGMVGGCGPWADPRALECFNEIVRRFMQGREGVKVHQIVLTKQPDGQYKIATMGLGGHGHGVVLDDDYGTPGEILAITAAMMKLLEPPK